MTEILSCHECEDRDCLFNSYGMCFSIRGMYDNFADGAYTCSGSVVNFNRNDYEKYFFEKYRQMVV